MTYLRKLWFCMLLSYVLISSFFFKWINNWHKHHPIKSTNRIESTVNASQDIYRTEKFRGIWKHASFMPYHVALPNYDQLLPRPPIRNSYLYAGLGLWESRGISLPRAIAAMLGDTSIFYESPLFTLFRTQMMGVNVADNVYDTLSFNRRHFSGYSFFMTDVVPFINVTNMLISLGYTYAYVDMAKRNESLASELAKILVDFHFYRRMSCNNTHNCNDVLPNLWKTFGDTDLGTRNDILWTSPYLSYVFCCGPNVIVLDPEANDRGICLGDWRMMADSMGGKNIHTRYQGTLDRPFLGRDSMGGEIMHPGYIYGSFIRGFELHYENPKLYPQKPSPIRLAFYKRSSISKAEKSYVIIIAPPDDTTYCIVNSEHMSGPSRMKSPPIVACDFSSTQGLNQKTSTYEVSNFHNFFNPCKSMCDSEFTRRPLIRNNSTMLPIAGNVEKHSCLDSTCILLLNV